MSDGLLLLLLTLRGKNAEADSLRAEVAKVGSEASQLPECKSWFNFTGPFQIHRVVPRMV